MSASESEPNSSPGTIPVIPPSDSDRDDDLDRPEGEKVMSLGDHIEELRSRLIISIAAFLMAFLPALIACYRLYDLFLLPLSWAGDGTRQLVTFRFEGPWEGIGVAVTLSLYTALILAGPVWVHQAWLFVSPGLTKRERLAAIPVFTAGSVLFLAGAAVAFLYGIPLGLQFLVDFNQGFSATANLWSPKQYFSFVGMACLGFGIGFETPLVMMALARVGLITPEGILRYWRQALLAIFFLGALLTPPDPLTQILLGSLMTALYFLGYALARWVAPGEEK